MITPCCTLSSVVLLLYSGTAFLLKITILIESKSHCTQGCHNRQWHCLNSLALAWTTSPPWLIVICIVVIGAAFHADQALYCQVSEGSSTKPKLGFLLKDLLTIPQSGQQHDLSLWEYDQLDTAKGVTSYVLSIGWHDTITESCLHLACLEQRPMEKHFAHLGTFYTCDTPFFAF